MPFYAVRVGRQPGIYESWDETHAQVNGYSGAVYKKFKTREEANLFIDGTAVLKVPDGPLDVVYTDGCCLNNGTSNARAGYGIWYGPSDPRNKYGRLPGKQTNQCAELVAVLLALVKVERPTEIRTDSQYAIHSCTDWLQTWRQNGFRDSQNRLLQNIDIIRKIDTYLQIKDHSVVFTYVPGHSGILGNEEADKLANKGANLPESYETIDDLVRSS